MAWQHGYVTVWNPNHPEAHKTGYMYEHRFVAEQKLGRPLKKTEIVHHINGDGTDNRPENLEICETRAHHKVEHRTVCFDHRKPGESNPIIECECGCGRRFEKYDKSGRPRRRSHACGRKGIHRFDITATVPCACGCGTIIPRFDSTGRERRYISGHNMIGRHR